MRIRTKVTIVTGLSIFAFVGLWFGVWLSGIDSREIGRIDPERAAHFRPPWFNFDETYTDGTALGVTVNSTRLDAIQAAERAGFTVSPSGWGDLRAGGAMLYDRPTLLAIMLRQPHLDFFDHGRSGLTVTFRGDRVVSVEVFYINFEGT